MSSTRLEYLFLSYYEKNISEREKDELMALVKLEENQKQLSLLIDRVLRNNVTEHRLDQETADEILSSIFMSASENATSDEEAYQPVYPWIRLFPLWLRHGAAAAAGVILLFGAYRWQQNKSETPPELISTIPKTYDAQPGGNKAQLTLSNGKVIDLNTIRSGEVEGQPGTKVNRAKGELTYLPDHEKDIPAVNTLRTPAGGQYKVILPDGSTAWLNAASSLTFPTTFSGNRRQVKMTGEVYFEIAPNKNSPFTVTTMGNADKQTEITVLGTHFNISSYHDEPSVQTTLLEGSVKVKRGKMTKVLVPGQQAQVTSDSRAREIEISKVNIESVVAWKEGRFEFDGNIKDIMRQIARWYDLDIEYQGNVGDKSFAGAISRKKNVSEVLKMLELTGDIHFSIDNKKIIVHN